MKIMKKSIIIFGAVAIALLMISSATAVKQVNNELVMKAIETERTQEDIINQLLALWDNLVTNNPLVAWFQDTYDIDAEEDFEQLFDHQGLLNHVISDDFINMLNSNLDEILAIEAFQIIYNTDPMQEYIQSDEFLEFMQTDEMQYLLSQLDGESEGSSETYESFSQQNSELLGILEGFYGVSTNEPQNVGRPNNGEVENDGATFQVYSDDEEQPTMNGALAFIGLLVGLITWIPAAIIIMIGAPFAFIYLFIEGILTGYWQPGWIIGVAIGSFILSFGFGIIAALGWPGLIAAAFGGAGYVMAL